MTVAGGSPDIKAAASPPPSPQVLSRPSPSAGTQHSCQSCTISEAAGAAQSCPTVCPSHSPFSHPTLSDGLCASPSATSVFSEHFNFTRSIQSSLLVSCSQLDLSECLFRWVHVVLQYFLLGLISIKFNFLSLSLCLCVCLSPTDVRKATTDCAVTSLSLRQMPSCQIQVCKVFFNILQDLSAFL